MVKEKTINKYKAALVLLDDVIEKSERQYEDEKKKGYVLNRIGSQLPVER